MPQHPTNRHKPYAWETGPMILLPNSILQADDAPPDPKAASKTIAVCNCLIRALNSIYIQAPHVPMIEYANLVSYCLATYQCLLAQLGTTFQKEEEDARLAEWGNWLESCAARRNNFSTEMCKSMMDDFMPVLHKKLSTPRNEETGKMGLDSNTQVPIFWTNHDVTSENQLPRGLAPDTKAIRWWIGRKKADWWKFSTCGFNGLPRELKFYREM
ncbi:hypothetical protein PtrSN002B_003165 [Pyrenophora tritici-repentis]|nr:uncharacterized protein PTRG_10466 [Pyrenophora tritici-repentis Pt-1C-BFP]KAA8621116.1 hypothetical protein PtrV1_05617 [Pyrenophora tritici-repentis]EDU43516.1 conserved hypothetical protein [Pyrenophora tritici-repentis Pt-1C-BFP]KAG9381417.1 hypothetical protein A1F94_008737 [Pyrenophora tritici-repentis]KAI1536660.1 hypothetical protein PtrSN001C_006433 [Pyrenophora tritici-repentis]KAI1537396.1 hypothetical protein PtrSN001A_005291 [Pyrenophora tritici-repentis]